jgi:hypothetical protein
MISQTYKAFRAGITPKHQHHTVRGYRSDGWMVLTVHIPVTGDEGYELHTYNRKHRKMWKRYLDLRLRCYFMEERLEYVFFIIS